MLNLYFKPRLQQFRLSPVAALLVLIVMAWSDPCLAAAPGSDKKPLLEAIEGDKIVVVITSEGNRVAGVGAELNFGDRVKTGPRASAKIRYPDGSKLLVGRATEVEVQESTSGVQFNKLHAGEVRGIIRKPKALQKNEGPPRFVIRSKAVVMGVRGTDFVFNLDETATKSSLHTLQGVVEVAKEEPDIMQGRGTLVRKSQFIQADGQVVGPPQEFDYSAYAKDLMAQQPEFVALVRNDHEIIEHNSVNGPEFKRAAPKRLSLLSFQFNQLVIRQESGGLVATGEVSWNPTLRIFGPLALRGHAGVFPLRGRSEEDRFVGFEGALLASVSLFKPLILEAGPGFQEWVGRTRNGPTLTAVAALQVSDDSFLERIFVGATFYDPEFRDGEGIRNSSRQIKAGIGIRF